MTKEKISITLSSSTVDKIEDAVDSDRFRNRSHVIEYLVIKYL